MKNLIQSVVMVFLSITTVSAEYKEVQFDRSSMADAMSNMISTGQYSLIYFTADWCMPCQVLQESHFRDERIIDYINQGFVSIKADYSEIDDAEWYETFEVRMLPTLLIMDKEGNEVDRIQNIRNTRQLYLFLHQYGSKKSYKADIVNVSKKNTTNNKSQKRATNPKAVLASYKPAADNIYAVDLDNYKAELSIQFGAYNRYNHAVRYLKELQLKEIPVFIKEEFVKGRKYYKVVQRASKNKIENLYTNYQSRGIDYLMSIGLSNCIFTLCRSLLSSARNKLFFSK